MRAAIELGLLDLAAQAEEGIASATEALLQLPRVIEDLT